jgi:cytidylate kinase
VESGALYRALTLAALDQGIELSAQRIVALAHELPVRLDLTESGFRPEVAGADVSREIRAERVTRHVSQVSALPEVRAWVNAAVRRAVATYPRGAVLDGRDIGTVVFPDAAVKVYLTATPEARARRRLLQDGAAADPAAMAREIEAIARRDRMDSTREVAPLKPAADAHQVDTTRLTLEEQVRLIVSLARNAFNQLDIGGGRV